MDAFGSAGRTVLRASVLAFVFGGLASGCGGSAPPPTAPAAHQESSAVTQTTKLDKKKKKAIPGSERVASPKLIDRRARNAVAPDSLGVVRSAPRPPKSAEEVYRAVAPATVIVRVNGGLGSGVIIDPAGWVLTNHHVIEHGTTEDFKTHVNIVLGHIDKTTGGMERDNKQYTAYVYKDDKLRDLALLKIDNPPKKLPYVTLSKDKPVPGEQVIAIGNAGAGMLWAIKAGEISALGKLSDHLASLASFKSDAAGKKASDEFKKYLDKQNLGLVIQSTCKILPGDSGGPLVTNRGDLVGLNAFSNKDPSTGGLLSFHVHINEIKKFLEHHPKQPAALVPDPWRDGGGDASYEDADLDGKIDVLLLQGRRACFYCTRQSAAVFMDLDQNSYKGQTKLPDLADTYKNRDFDAEVVYLQLEGRSLVWYDTDNDGKYDVLLVDQGTTGRASAAYRIDSSGALKKDDALISGRVIRMSLMKDVSLRQRLQRVASAAFPDRYVEASSSLGDTLPEPLGTTGKGMSEDLDHDGVKDAVRISNAFSTRLVVDADQNSMSSLPFFFEVEKTIKPGMLDPEVSIITQSTHTWVWYDTDNDGRMDLVLHSPRSRLYVAAEAWHVDAAGKRTAAPEDVGRKLIRPDLLGNGAMAARMRTMVDKSFLSILSASDAGLGSFPDPIKDHRGVGFSLMKTKAEARSVVVAQGQGSDGYLVDLDESTLRFKPLKKLDVNKLVQKGKFDAEFAYFQRNGLAWAYYDTDNNGSYDTVVYTSDPRGGKVEQGFRIDKSGKVTVDPGLVGQTMVRYSLFKKKSLSSNMKKFEKDLFGDKMIEK